jgi:hypothetical protein
MSFCTGSYVLEVRTYPDVACRQECLPSMAVIARMSGEPERPVGVVARVMSRLSRVSTRAAVCVS